MSIAQTDNFDSSLVTEAVAPTYCLNVASEFFYQRAVLPMWVRLNQAYHGRILRRRSPPSNEHSLTDLMAAR